MGGRPSGVQVVVRRGELVESTHAVHVVVLDAKGPVATAGDPGRSTYYRSASKPFQALPLVEDGVLGRFGLTSEELALCCASHNGEPEHVAGARSILEKVGLDESALECGGHWPLREAMALRWVDEGRVPQAIDSNCSGKHAGMLALARHHGWEPTGYRLPGHPVQRRMASEIARWTGCGESELATGIDGCGVVCFAVPLIAIARSYLRFGVDVMEEGPAAVVRDAMVGHPFMVAGTGRLCTDLMAVGGGIVAKTGAEGVYGAVSPEAGVAVAIKAEDGNRRASEAVLVAVLDALRLLPSEVGETLDRHRSPVVRNTRGEAVGSVEVLLDLEWARRPHGPLRPGGGLA